MALKKDADGASSRNASPVQYRPSKQELSGIKLKSELLDKLVVKKDFNWEAALSGRNSQALTSQERGALPRTGGGFMDALNRSFRASVDGAISPEVMREIKLKRHYDYKSTNEYLKSRDIAMSATEEDLTFYDLLKEGNELLGQFANAQGEDRLRFGERLNTITATLSGREPDRFTPELLDNPLLYDHFAGQLQEHQTRYTGLDYADRVFSKAEEQKKELGLAEIALEDYTTLSPGEKLIAEQDFLFKYLDGASIVDYTVGSEPSMLEAQGVDMTAVHKRPDGTMVPVFVRLAENNAEQSREMRELLTGILNRTKGTALYDRVRKQVEKDLATLNENDLRDQGLVDRYAPGAEELAKQGEQLYRQQFVEERWQKFGLPAMRKDPMYSPLRAEKPTMLFDLEWDKKLKESAARNVGTPAPEVKAAYEQEFKAFSASQLKKLSLEEITGQDDPRLDAYRVNIMSDEEKKTYFMYFAQSPEKAHQYAKAINGDLLARAAKYREEVDKALSTGSIWQQGVSGFVSIFNALEKVKGAAYLAATKVRGEAINPYAASFASHRQQQTIREQINQNTVDRFGPDSVITKGIKLLSDIGFATGDSILGMKGMGLPVYSFAGGSAAAPSAKLRGATDEQAFALFVANSASEFVTELIPWDAANKAFSTGFTLKGLFTSICGEAVGETMSAVFGDAADRKIMRDQSEYALAVKSLQEQRMPLLEAQQTANRQMLSGHLYEGLVGLASGGVTHGYASAVGSISQWKSTRAEQNLLKGASNPADVSGTLTGILAEYETGGNQPRTRTDSGHLQDLAADQERLRGPRPQAAAQAVDLAELQGAPGVDMKALSPIEGDFDPALAGELLVYERQDGSRQIVDGHRRVVKAQEIGLDSLPAQIVSEALGVSPEGMNALARIRASHEVDIGPLAGLDTGLLNQAAEGRMPLDTAAQAAQAFPQQYEMQREYWRLLAGRDLSPAAQGELAQALQAAQAQGVDPGDLQMETIAERSEIAARVKGMLAAEARHEGPLAEQTAAAAQQLMAEYQQGGEAFDLLDSLAQDYADGSLNLRQAADQGYQKVLDLARELADSLMREPAIKNAADSVQALMGQHGPEVVRDFFSAVFEQVDGSDYQAQQDTMNKIRDTALLPVEAPARRLLDSLMTGEAPVIPETLGELNRLAGQDLAAPEYQEAIENNREEAGLAREVASQISKGALSDLDARSVQLDGQQQALQLAADSKVQADARLQAATQAFQGFVAEVVNANLLSPDMATQHNQLLQRMSTAKAEANRAAKQLEKARTAYEAAEQNYQQDYADRVNTLRRAALANRTAEIQAEQAPVVPTDAQPVQAQKTQIEGIQPYAMTPTALPVEMPTASTRPGPVRSAHQIFSDLGKALKVPYNANRKQFLRQAKNQAAGYFVPAENTVHVQSAQDIQVAAHEFGHYLDKTLRLGSHPVVSEIVSWLKANRPDYAARYKGNELTGEAVAEVTKLWMTNRDQAARQFGELVADMENGMKQAGVFKAFEQARQQIERTLTADSIEQTMGRIQMDDGASAIKEYFSPGVIEKLRAKIFDATLPLATLTKAEMAALGKDFQYSKDARTIALKNNRVDNYIRQNIENNLVDVEGNVILDRGFSDNFHGIKKGEMKAFADYLLKNHELDRARVGKSIYGNQYSLDQVKADIATHEQRNERFKPAREKLNEWYDAFMREYVVKPGVLTEAQYEAMHAMYPNYVPTYRVMEQGESGFRGSRDARKGLKKAGQSDLDIKNPIENMSRQVMFYTRQAHQLHLGNVFADQIERLGDMGYIAEKVQPDMRYSPEIDRMVQEAQEQAALYKQRLLEADPTVDTQSLDQLEGLMLDTAKKAVFTVSDQATGANVLNVLGQDGNYRSFVVHDPGVMKVLANSSPVQSTALFKMLGGLTRMISVTATSANAMFAVTNAIRDMMTQMVWGSTSTNPVTETGKWLTMLPQTLAAKHGKGKYAEAYRQFETMAEMGSKYSMQVGRSSKAMMEAATNPRSVKSMAGKAIKMVTLQNVNELIENTTRFMEYVHGKSELGGKNIQHLDSYEGRIRAMLASTGVTVDFARKGSSPVMQQLGALVPFLNAGLQGVHKTLSLFSHENQGRRARIVSKMAVNGLMLGVVSSLLLNMMLDDKEKEEYDQMDEGFKNTNVFVKLGKETMLRVPLSQDMLFQALYAGGRMIAQAFNGEGITGPDGLVSTAKSIIGEQMNYSFVLGPIMNVRENKTWYGGQIEPDSVEGLPMKDRYDERTTGAARWLSENLGGMSPMMWDYFIPQYTGIYGRLAVNTMQAAKGDANLGSAFMDTVRKQVASRFTTSPAYSSQIYQNYKNSFADLAAISKLAKMDRAISFFDPSLSQEEVNGAVREVDQMMKNGGSLFEIRKKINDKWAEYSSVVENDSLSEDERTSQSKQLRQDINMLALEGNGIIAEYEAKYFTGAARLQTRHVDNNLQRLKPEGYEVTRGMGDELYKRFQAGDKTAGTLYKLADRFGNNDFVNAKPSMEWTGFEEVQADDARIGRINDTYYRTLGSELGKYSVTFDSKGLSEERAKKIVSDAKKIATEAARKAAFEGTDQKYTTQAQGWYKDAVERRDPVANTALSLAKQHDDPYYVSRYPSMTWKGFDLKAASPVKVMAIERVYYGIIEEGLRKYGDQLRSMDKAAARKLMEKISNQAATAAKKEALRKD